MTIVRRNDRYGVKVWDRGQKRYRWLGSFDTEDLARQAEADAKLRPGKDSPTVAQWSRIWLSDYARSAPSTQRNYRYAVNRIAKDVGHLTLAEVTRREARRLANDWSRATTKVAKTMWADAVRDELCESNPWSNMRLQTLRGREGLTALSEAEILRLADIAQETHGDYGSEVRAIILTLAYTGMRPGELYALRRTDLDTRSSLVTVRLTVDGTGREKLPKNGRVRVVVVPPDALAAIRAMPGSVDEYLFHSVRGKRLNKSALSYIWRPTVAAWKQAGGRDIDLYELRHACATLMLERGLPPHVVANQLGHQDGGGLVQRLYGHPEERRMREQTLMAFAEVPDDATERRAG